MSLTKNVLDEEGQSGATGCFCYVCRYQSLFLQNKLRISIDCSHNRKNKGRKEGGPVMIRPGNDCSACCLGTGCDWRRAKALAASLHTEILLFRSSLAPLLRRMRIACAVDEIWIEEQMFL